MIRTMGHSTMWKFFTACTICALVPVSSSSSGGDNSGGEVHSRQKRFIYFNTQTPVDVGLIITLPISFALPTFNLKTSRRFRRDSRILDLDMMLQNLTTDDVLPRGSYDDVAYNQELNKMSLYFNVLEVNEDVCQQRVLCEVFSDEESYRPVTDLFKRKLTVDRGPVLEKHTNRYYRYVQAMQDGLVNGDAIKCQKLYQRCPYSAHDRLHLASLRFWTFLASTLHLQFLDD